MRKILRILIGGILFGAVTITVVGCKDQNYNQTTDTKDTIGSAEADEEEADISDSLDLLNTIWANYAEEDKFSAAGGDYSEENSVMGAPGNFEVSDAEVLDSVLAFPADCISMIDNAASLMHMMNANTFTCGTFHVTDSANLSAAAEKLKDNILQRQWICGFPDKLIVVTVGNYVVSAFGNDELIDTFKDRLFECYQTAELVYEEKIE